MPSIQSSIGLITGVPIQDTVDQLISISAIPRNRLQARNNLLQSEQVAIAQLTSMALGLQLAASQLGKDALFDERTVTSSDTSLLAASVSDGAIPSMGVFEVMPVHRAQTHQLLSTGFDELTDPIGEGSLSFRFGGRIDDGIKLSELNAGDGIQRGYIRITDRSGSTGTIDLRFAETVDDVLDAINNNNDINVTAEAVGDAFRLTDNTGATLSNLIVQELGFSTTAADLGLGGINVAADTVTGQDVVSLYGDLDLSQLNDGNGVAIRDALSDLEVTFRDGSSALAIDFHHPGSDATAATAITNAANGDTARLVFTAKEAGSQYEGVSIVFEDTATAGAETYVYNDVAKTLTIGIESGVSTAIGVMAALSREGNEDAAALFDAAFFDFGGGAVTVADTGTFSGGADEVAPTAETTLGDILDTINAADPARLRAELSSDGDRIVLTDLTADSGGTFSVASTVGGAAAEDLGLTGTAVGDTITGGRLQAGLKTSMLRSFNGGAGIGPLGLLDLTDRSGAADTVDLSAAETISDVVETINASSVGITARVNDSRNGIVLTDTTGSSSGNLIVANGDATNTADALKIAVDDSMNSVDSQSLGLQVVGSSTKLSSLNGGEGVHLGSFVITDSAGEAGAVKLNESGAQITTVGGVIEAINALAIGVTARISDTGDGILLTDTAGDAATLTVREVGSGTTAEDLNLLGEAVVVDVGGTPTQVIDGSMTATVQIEADDTLQDLIDEINDRKLGVTASSFFDGSDYRLTLTSQVSGRTGEILIDAHDSPFSFHETSKAQDALLLFGASDDVTTGLLVTSSSNTFENVVGGLDFVLNDTSTSPVTVTVERSHDSLEAAVQQFVTSYNSLRDKVDEHTFFNEADQSTGILFASHETLRIETRLANLVTGRFFGVGDIQSLETIGVSMNDQGKLTFSSDKLIEALEANPDAVKEFFATEELGVADKFDSLLEGIAGADASMLVSRTDALEAKIDDNNDRIEFLSERLEAERNRMLLQFYNMELIIGKLQASLTAIAQIQPMPLIAFGGNDN